ncbi:MAG: hypothetical protein JW704_10550 [Anaerolineaceae bacterium]|nr:hypothetical protein [Anaerolineaceae bacterium]
MKIQTGQASVIRRFVLSLLRDNKHVFLRVLIIFQMPAGTPGLIKCAHYCRDAWGGMIQGLTEAGVRNFFGPFVTSRRKDEDAARG